jgi:hypothetical protein
MSGRARARVGACAGGARARVRWRARVWRARVGARAYYSVCSVSTVWYAQYCVCAFYMLLSIVLYAQNCSVCAIPFSNLQHCSVLFNTHSEYSEPPTPLGDLFNALSIPDRMRQQQIFANQFERRILASARSTPHQQSGSDCFLALGLLNCVSEPAAAITVRGRIASAPDLTDVVEKGRDLVIINNKTWVVLKRETSKRIQHFPARPIGIISNNAARVRHHLFQKALKETFVFASGWLTGLSQEYIYIYIHKNSMVIGIFIGAGWSKQTFKYNKDSF